MMKKAIWAKLNDVGWYDIVSGDADTAAGGYGIPRVIVPNHSDIGSVSEREADRMARERGAMNERQAIVAYSVDEEIP